METEDEDTPVMDGLDLLSRFNEAGQATFVVEGRWCVEALLQSELEVEYVVRAQGSHADLEELYLHRADFYAVDRARLSETAGYPFHRGVLALAKRPRAAPLDTRAMRGLLVACPEIGDASNLGAIIRTAAALGAAGVLVETGRGADVYSRKTIRASSGAIFRIPVHQCDDLARELSGLGMNGFELIATSPDPKHPAVAKADFSGNGVVVLGPENGGLSREWLSLCTLAVRIPMGNGVDSLNVAAGAAIVLYELLRER